MVRPRSVLQISMLVTGDRRPMEIDPTSPSFRIGQRLAIPRRRLTRCRADQAQAADRGLIGYRSGSTEWFHCIWYTNTIDNCACTIRWPHQPNSRAQMETISLCIIAARDRRRCASTVLSTMFSTLGSSTRPSARPLCRTVRGGAGLPERLNTQGRGSGSRGQCSGRL